MHHQSGLCSVKNGLLDCLRANVFWGAFGSSCSGFEPLKWDCVFHVARLETNCGWCGCQNKSCLIRIMAILSSLSQTAVCERDVKPSEHLPLNLHIRWTDDSDLHRPVSIGLNNWQNGSNDLLWLFLARHAFFSFLFIRNATSSYPQGDSLKSCIYLVCILQLF